MPANLVQDPGVEEQPSSSVTPPWTNIKGAFISADDSHTGTRSAKVTSDSQNGTYVTGWNDINQLVSVTPGATYSYQAWVKTSANLAYGRIGVRSNPDFMNELADNLGYQFGALSEWTFVSTRFTAATTVANIYIGASDNNGVTSVLVDDVVVTKENSCL